MIIITSDKASSYPAIAIGLDLKPSGSGQSHITAPIDTYISGISNTIDTISRMSIARVGLIFSFFSDLSEAGVAL